MFGIFEAIKGFFEFIISVIGFVISLFKDLANVVRILAQTVVSIPAYLGFLPTVIVSLFAACLTVVVLYKVLGRT